MLQWFLFLWAYSMSWSMKQTLQFWKKYGVDLYPDPWSGQMTYGYISFHSLFEFFHFVGQFQVSGRCMHSTECNFSPVINLFSHNCSVLCVIGGGLVWADCLAGLETLVPPSKKYPRLVHTNEHGSMTREDVRSYQCETHLDFQGRKLRRALWGQKGRCRQTWRDRNRKREMERDVREL